MADMFHFTDENFKGEVLENGQPVLVNFTAEWCGPCHMLAPVVDKLNQEWNGTVKVGQLDIDANIAITMQFGVMGVPTLILFKAGQPVERLTGYMQKERILSKLRPYLG